LWNITGRMAYCVVAVVHEVLISPSQSTPHVSVEEPNDFR
jgi:hypothetical protein